MKQVEFTGTANHKSLYIEIWCQWSSISPTKPYQIKQSWSIAPWGPSRSNTAAAGQQALLDAQLNLWHNTFAFIKSTALKCALELHIADAIHHHGCTATLHQIATVAKLHPSKLPCLHRLMRVLTVTGFFGVAKNPAEDGDRVYGLTPASRLLIGSQNLTPTLSLILHNMFVSPFLDLGTWLKHELPDLALFKMAHGKGVWDVIIHDATISPLFNAGMIADSLFLMDIAIKECGHVFQGISSLIDVAGGHGAAAQAIAKAFPHIDCSVLDLQHIIANAPADTGLKYIAGDMFESIPQANAVFLKITCETCKNWVADALVFDTF